MKECADCQGSGIISGFACPGFHPVQIKCFTCLGEGEVSASREEAIAKGEAMRQDRISRGVSLRQEAERLGFSPMELSHWEQGEPDEARLP